MKDKVNGLTSRDKTPKPSGWGVDFHHTDPQRRVRCVIGDMLAPRSADDIAPISAEAITSVRAALELLACLVEDRDFNLFMGCGDAETRREHDEAAKHIRLAARGIAGILRVG